MSLCERMSGKLGVKAIQREFEVLYALYHHESLAKDEIPHYLHYPECNWLETTLDDLECMRLINSKPTRGWLYEITDAGKAVMQAELDGLSKWYVYKAYIKCIESAGVDLFHAAHAFLDWESAGMFEGFDP